MSNPVSNTTPELTAPTKAEVVRAATNDPALSTRSVTLGDRTFTVVDLPYDDYIKFVLLVTPLLDSFVNGMAKGAALSVQGIPQSSFSARSLIEYCADDLPEMARIVCRQTSPEITVDELKRLAKSPLKLAEVCLVQIEQNKMIEEFAGFFPRMASLLTKANLSISE